MLTPVPLIGVAAVPFELTPIAFYTSLTPTVVVPDDGVLIITAAGRAAAA